MILQPSLPSALPKELFHPEEIEATKPGTDERATGKTPRVGTLPRPTDSMPVDHHAIPMIHTRAEGMALEEWKARLELAALYRVFHARGWDEVCA